MARKPSELGSIEAAVEETSVAAAALVGPTGEPLTPRPAPPAAASVETMAARPASSTAAAVETMAAARVGFDKSSAEVKTNMEKAMKTAEEFVSFSQGNLEAMLRSSQIWAAGVQDIGKQFAASAQAQVDQTVATFKALTSVKSLKEAIDLQSGLARASVEKAVADTGKFTDASLKLAEQALAPITARVTLAVEKFGRTV